MVASLLARSTCHRLQSSLALSSLTLYSQQAAAWGHFSLYDFLCSIGFDETWEDADRCSPLDILLELYPGCRQISSRPDSVFEDRRFSLLHEAMLLSTAYCNMSPRLLEQNHNEVCTGDKTGMTPLHWAAVKNDLEAVNLLLDWKADPNRVDVVGVTALHYACRNGGISIATALIHAGGKVDVPDRLGQTALFNVDRNEEAMVALLLEHGADIHHVTSTGETALHRAAWIGNAAFCRCLMRNGLCINVGDQCGETPLGNAIYMDHEKCVSAMLETATATTLSYSPGALSPCLLDQEYFRNAINRQEEPVLTRAYSCVSSGSQTFKGKTSYMPRRFMLESASSTIS